MTSPGPRIPPIGFGTSPGAGRSAGELAPAIRAALAAGFRLFDTAEVSGSETVLGDAIAGSGVPRGELYLVSKLWQTNHAFDHAIAACEGSLRRLGVERLDLYLIHSPEAWRHVGPLDLDAGLSREEIAARVVPAAGGKELRIEVPVEETWGALQELRRRGLVRSIGVANFGVAAIETLTEATGCAPEVVQAEIHPGRPCDELVAYCRGHGIALMAHSPLGGGDVLGDPRIERAARELAATPAQAVLRWHLARGVIPIPGSHRPEHVRENFGALGLELEEGFERTLAALVSGAAGAT